MSIREKIETGYYDKVDIANYKQAFCNDLSKEHPNATQEMVEFAWKWGSKSRSNHLEAVYECFMDLLLVVQ